MPTTRAPERVTHERTRAGIAVAILLACAALGLAAEPARSAPLGAVAPATVMTPAGQTPPPGGVPAAPVPTPSTAGPELKAEALILDEANAADGRLGFTIRNTANEPLTIEQVHVDEAWVGFAGDAKQRLEKPVPAIACTGNARPATTPFTLAPRTSCTVALPLGLAAAGKHEVKVTIAGAAGGVHTIRPHADIKLGVWHAVLVILAGLLVGAAVSFWSGRGRERWSEAASVKAALEMLEAQAASTVEPRARIAGIAAAAADLQRRILAGEGYDAAEIGELWRRSRFINYFLLQERKAGAGDAVRDATTKAIEALAPGAQGRFDVPVTDAMIEAAADAIVAAGARGGPEADDTARPPARTPLPINAGLSSGAIARWQWLIEIAVAAAVACVFAAIALQSVYFNQPVWGSLPDQIAAFIIGFGAYTGSVASVDAFIARARKT